jgi:hypothetical protein
VALKMRGQNLVEDTAAKERRLLKEALEKARELPIPDGEGHHIPNKK